MARRQTCDDDEIKGSHAHVDSKKAARRLGLLLGISVFSKILKSESSFYCAPVNLSDFQPCGLSFSHFRLLC